MWALGEGWGSRVAWGPLGSRELWGVYSQRLMSRSSSRRVFLSSEECTVVPSVGGSLAEGC